MMPLYLAMTPPTMLPTTTLNPLTTATASSKKSKRDVLPLAHEVLFKRTPGTSKANNWWWAGVFFTASGGVLYWFF